jgi:hypothetical protein
LSSGLCSEQDRQGTSQHATGCSSMTPHLLLSHHTERGVAEAGAGGGTQMAAEQVECTVRRERVELDEHGAYPGHHPTHSTHRPCLFLVEYHAGSTAAVS